MKPVTIPDRGSGTKEPTGIVGFDAITGGGLPRGRTTLLVGGPGSGKTVFALQYLAHGAQKCNQPGIFVAFEELSARVIANAQSFGWSLPGLQRRKRLLFVDAQPPLDLVQSGNFDLGGMLALLDANIARQGTRRIVFDALDVPLMLLSDHAAVRREIHRLHEWLLARELSGIVTAKLTGVGVDSVEQSPFGLMQFMVDCAVVLGHSVVEGVSQRNVRVRKYRGSAFDEDEAPLLIGNGGLEVSATRPLGDGRVKASAERVSSGIERLDTMLDGGYFRGASVLLTGYSGTAKTTLGAAFAEAACTRGERTLFVSFDSEHSEVIRNLASVGIRLERYLRSQCLLMMSARSISGSAETYLVRIKERAKQHGARCLVIDPVSIWSKSSSALTAQSVADRLLHWAKCEGITLLCTSLLDEMSSQMEGGSQLQLSTLVDTWIHLNYLVQGGERNRSLSIIKSRGTAHSNQVRELILSSAGISLTDTFAAGGDVLMGTLRWEKENAERTADAAAAIDVRRKHALLDAQQAGLEVQAKSLQAEIAATKVERTLLIGTLKERREGASKGRARIRELRGADAVRRPAK